MEVNTTRRQFLKGLGALAVFALPACRKAQEYTVEPEGCPEWMHAGEAQTFASAMPWATGAVPLLAACHGGLPTSLQPNPHEKDRRGLPAFVQASILDLYDPVRPAAATFNGKPFPAEAVRGAFRGWSRALREGSRVAFLFPEGWSAVRTAQLAALAKLPGVQTKNVHCYRWDPAAHARPEVFSALAAQQKSAFGPACCFETGFPGGEQALARLTEQLRQGQLDLLLIFTPADPAAFDTAFAEALLKTEAETVRFCLRPDVTASRCMYMVPQTHFLEEWGAEADAAGKLCLRQPMTFPLRPAYAEAEALDALLGCAELPDPQQRPAESHIRSWTAYALRTAVQGKAWGDLPVADEAATMYLEQTLRRGFVEHAVALPKPLPPAQEGTPYLHPLFVDGRFLHNAWLREVYDSLSGAAGAPAVFLPGTENAAGGARVADYHLPAWSMRSLRHPLLPLLPGISPDGRVIPTQEPPQGIPVQQAKHMDPRELRKEKPGGVRGASPQWGMSIDIAACIGCNACTLACRAENNIPVVGAEQQSKGRDMQWLRLERYFDEGGEVSFFLPSACRQCENAPCESVCPVNATVHTAAGLNAMVYPRCWGTRYCAAACPYRARTFNFYDYARASQRELRLPPNPDVTVRSRGVMEKCSYCVQRINAAKLTGEMPRTACEEACPTGAIHLLDLIRQPLDAVVTNFDIAQTNPRTRYLYNH